ncbi:MAG TPA: protein-methionine-sulfoxide reductase catalytic subunit MsrP, partial [Gammaproteobacteria bacterium]|nr:protein-methionine-sulfoxide reductase catalytic subunit MsrP [Gammaproteobacteria bacterium]
MLIRVRRRSDPLESEVTPEQLYYGRRRFLQVSALAIAGAMLGPGSTEAAPAEQLRPLGPLLQSPLSTSERPNRYDEITSYNNFYEFGYGKEDPARLAPGLLKTEPWTVTVGGECEQPGVMAVEALLRAVPLEERIYRLRCVEGWSMVIPWVGIPLASVLQRFRPTSRAKYVEFVTLYDPRQMPNQKHGGLPWPYREGLRIDEAMHPLTILAVGLYGKVLPAQNGAPRRLVVPWKYGFKSSKSIVAINFREQQPQTTWSLRAPQEYGFYANVNPAVDHPRWSQKRERRI